MGTDEKPVVGPTLDDEFDDALGDLSIDDIEGVDDIKGFEEKLPDEEPPLAEMFLDDATFDDLKPELPQGAALDDDVEPSPAVSENATPDVALDDVALDDVALDDVALDNDATLDGGALDDDVALDDVALDGDATLDGGALDDNATLDGGALDDNAADMTDNSISENDSLEDILSMLDDDAELAEINDMLKKSDNKEPIKDDMMDLLNQMADDEAASVNAGVTGIDEDDGGVPLPEVAKYRPAKKADEDIEVIDESAPKKKKEKQKKTSARKQKKESRKKKKDAAEEEIEELLEEADAEDEAKEKKPKKPSKVGKFFNMMTEDLVPEPTEEELQAEKDAKEAKKKENLTKKEEEKAAKAEAKKAQAEQKEADKKAKAEEAAKKKKEKQAAKEAKAQAKREKQAAEKPKKRIPPKNKAAAAAFGIAVGGAVLVSTNILAKQGFLQTARAAYYNQDYKTVYQSTYGMELDENETDGIIKARSEVILKMQRRYDSYQTNLKMGREIEALDALLQGIATYDYINADAEQYGVMDEVDSIKDDILNILDTKYGLSEAEARELINNDDALSYTLELNNIVNNVR